MKKVCFGVVGVVIMMASCSVPFVGVGESTVRSVVGPEESSILIGGVWNNVSDTSSIEYLNGSDVIVNGNIPCTYEVDGNKFKLYFPNGHVSEGTYYVKIKNATTYVLTTTSLDGANTAVFERNSSPEKMEQVSE